LPGGNRPSAARANTGPAQPRSLVIGQTLIVAQVGEAATEKTGTEKTGISKGSGHLTWRHKRRQERGGRMSTFAQKWG
jgi:hypothetical protein